MIIEETIENGILIKNIIYEESDKRSDADKIQLLEICTACEFNQGFICGKCGCVVETKMFYIDSKCPINKW